MGKSVPLKGSTVKRRRVAAELRRLREEAGLTCAQVGEHLDRSEATVSRIETAKASFNLRDVRDMLTLYGVTDEQRDQLMDLARKSREKGWWQGYSDVVVSPYVDMEAESSAIRTYEAQLVPGLLQTEDYTRAQMRAGRPAAGPNEIERRVSLRMARQRRLTEDNPPQFWAVIDEAALRRQVGGPKVLRQQLDRLLEASELPHVELQVLPFDAGAHPGVDGSFVLLGFPEPGFPDVVFVDTLTGGLGLEEPDNVDRYTLVYTHLQAAALSPNDSAALIRKLAQELA